MDYRTALVTGASSGLGWRLAEKLARRGTEVVLIARRADRLDEILQGIAETGGKARKLALDVADTTALVAAIEQVDDELGGLDLVVANAGLGEVQDARTLTWAQAEPMVSVNFAGAIATLTAVLPRMVGRRRGHLVGVSSLGGLVGLPGSAVYGATKAGLLVFLEALRAELRGTGVLVSSVLPGFVRTDMTAKNAFPMPFLMELEPAADRILRGIDRGERVIEFPRALSGLMHGLSALPGGVLEALAARFSVFKQ